MAARPPLGVAAVSYAVAPAVIAALETQPQFIVGIGGYRDAEAAIRFVPPAFRPVDDPREHRMAPNNYGRWAFLLANAGRVDDPNDAAALQAIALAHWRGGDAGALGARLGPEGQAVLALVENRIPMR